MDTKKYEQLITLLTNNNEEQARSLFHDIVVEKSREIYESMLETEDPDQIDSLMDEISSEEEGMVSEEDDEQFELDDVEVEDDDVSDDLDGIDDEEALDDVPNEFPEEDPEESQEDMEDRIVNLEDKLDELMAEFEELMAEEGEEPEHQDDGAVDSEEAEESDEEGEEADGEDKESDEEDEELAESVQLQPVKGLYASKIGGDNGAQPKSPTLTKPKVVSTGAKPVGFSQGDEKGRAAPTAKTVPGNFKNAPGQKKQDGESATKPTTSQAASTNAKSPLGEGKTRR